MARLTHKPGHPLADKTGWVDKEAYLEYEANKDYMENGHLRYTEGNREVRVGYINDIMEPTRHMGTGKIHTSKSKFRQDTKASGCIEVGNEVHRVLTPRKTIELDRRQRVNDIRRAVYELKNGRKI